jgi:hypothetical protein
MCLPHHHHHEKKVRKTPSGNNLVKMVASTANFQDLVAKKGFLYILLTYLGLKNKHFLFLQIVNTKKCWMVKR